MAYVLTTAIALVASGCNGDDTARSDGATYRVDFATTKVRITNGRGRSAVAPPQPNVVNVWFRVTVGFPGSATVGSSAIQLETTAPPSTALAQDEAVSVMSAVSPEVVGFDEVPLLDIDDLEAGERLEVIGVWSWAFDDQHTLDDEVLAELQHALNDNVSEAYAPHSGPALAATVADRLIDALRDVRSKNRDLFERAEQQSLGSRVFVGLGATGMLGAMMDSALAESDLPEAFGAPATGITNLRGASLFSLGPKELIAQPFSAPGEQRHEIDFSVTTQRADAP